MPYFSGPNRFVCDCLEEIRKCCQTLNFAPIPGLVEEIQTMVNRMEAKLRDIKDLEYLHNEIKSKKKELKKLQAKIDVIEESTDQ